MVLPMVASVSGNILPAVFPGSPAALKLAQQNAVLPSPLPSPEQQAQQRGAAILRFDRPVVSPDILNSLTESGLRNSTSTTGGSDPARRAAEAYREVQQTLQPLLALATPPAPVPNPAGLAPGAGEAGTRQDRETSRIRDRTAEPDGNERDGRRAGSAARDERRETGSAAAEASRNPLLPEARTAFPARPAAVPQARAPGLTGVTVDIGA